MLITITQQQAPLRWTVHMDGWFVHFDSQAQAEAFVQRLQARLDAPHPWPSTGVAGSENKPVGYATPRLIRSGRYG